MKKEKLVEDTLPPSYKLAVVLMVVDATSVERLSDEPL